MEPKLVLSLSETKRLFQLFRFFTETAIFGVSVEPKQKKDQLNTEFLRNKFCFFSQKKFFHILDRLGLYLNAINLKFSEIVENYVTYSIFSRKVLSHFGSVRP